MNSNETNKPESPNEPPEEIYNAAEFFEPVVRNLENNRLWYENFMTRAIQKENGVPRERLYDPKKHKEDKDKLDKAVAKELLKYKDETVKLPKK